MSLRFDQKTGKTYTWFNIPLPNTTSAQTENGYFVIMNENHSHPEDSWYNGSFIGDRYAVFKWIKSTTSTGFYQQISPWYAKYGNARNKLF